jgi:DNA polymerase-3 subunit beta
MKTRLPRQEFQDALAAIATVTSGRTPKPILTCVRLETRGERVELCGTDGEATLHLSVVTIGIDEPGVAVVAADRLLGIIRELDDVEITLEADDRACVIRGERSEFKIYVMNPADFPDMREAPGEVELSIDGRELRRLITLTAHAAARETSRYAINGVLWQKRGKRLFLVATDGRRLARAGGSLLEAKGADFQLIVPAKALAVFERVFTPPRDGDDWTIELRVMPNQITLQHGERRLTTALVEGTFPNYEDVIPKESNKRARLDCGEFHRAIRRAALLTTEDSRAVRLSFESGRLVIYANSPEQGEARVELPANYEGEPVDIGFNPNFISDALKTVPYDSVCIEMQESFRPGVISGEDKADYLYVVMPVSLAPQAH